jgi:hypothetical protein
VLVGGAGACGDDKSAIMLVVTTDMKAPKDVNAVSVTVSANNAVKHNVIGRVTPQGDVLLPATLAIVEPDDPNTSIAIRVMAFQERKARVLRDVRTSIPGGGRVALLRIPLNFVNDGSTQGELPEGVLPTPDDGSSAGGSSGGSSTSGGSGAGALGTGDVFDPFTFVPNCPNPEHTWIDGECRDAYVDPATLPDFDAAAVGSSDPAAACFDVARCFGNASPVGRVVTFNRDACTMQLNGADASRLNLALVTSDTGECVRPNECYVPLDRGNGGWTVEGGEVKLPAFVCKLLASKNLRLDHSLDCTAKLESNAICIASSRAAGASDGGTMTCEGNAPPAGAERQVAVTLRSVDFGTSSTWMQRGYNLDAACTTESSNETCRRVPGAARSAVVDGEGGRDNSFGRNVLPTISAIWPTAESSDAILITDASGEGTFHWQRPDGYLSLAVHRVLVDTSGRTVSAIVDTGSLEEAIRRRAGRMSPELCSGTTIDSVLEVLRQSSDILRDGMQDPERTCDGISLGATFASAVTGAVAPPAAPDSCQN